LIPEKSTPWQRVYSKFDLKPSELARLLNRHRSKITRALKDDAGLISGKDQAALLKLAREREVDLRPSDMLPV